MFTEQNKIWSISDEQHIMLRTLADFFHKNAYALSIDTTYGGYKVWTITLYYVNDIMVTYHWFEWFFMVVLKNLKLNYEEIQKSEKHPIDVAWLIFNKTILHEQDA